MKANCMVNYSKTIYARVSSKRKEHIDMIKGMRDFQFM